MHHRGIDTARLSELVVTAYIAAIRRPITSPRVNVCIATRLPECQCGLQASPGRAPGDRPGDSSGCCAADDSADDGTERSEPEREQAPLEPRGQMVVRDVD